MDLSTCAGGFALGGWMGATDDVAQQREMDGSFNMRWGLCPSCAAVSLIGVELGVVPFRCGVLVPF